MFEYRTLKQLKQSWKLKVACSHRSWNVVFVPYWWSIYNWTITCNRHCFIQKHRIFFHSSFRIANLITWGIPYSYVNFTTDQGRVEIFEKHDECPNIKFETTGKSIGNKRIRSSFVPWRAFKVLRIM